MPTLIQCGSRLIYNNKKETNISFLYMDNPNKTTEDLIRELQLRKSR